MLSQNDIIEIILFFLVFPGKKRQSLLVGLFVFRVCSNPKFPPKRISPEEEEEKEDTATRKVESQRKRRFPSPFLVVRNSTIISPSFFEEKD